MPTSMARLPRFARELQRATTFDDLLTIAREELAAALGYQHAWMYVRESDDAPVMRLLSAIGGAAVAWDQAPTLPIAGDAMLEEIMRGEEPVVVVDARTDPRTDKAMVAAFGNRTIVNVPLRLVDRPFGAFGTGTFGDEPCRAPTPAQLDYLTAMCAQLVVAAGRIRLQEERRISERRQRELEQQLFRAQRLESLAVLAGGVAHDFNNLITVIIACVALARRRAGASAEELDTIEAAARRGHDLTRQLLALSRAQALSVQSVDLEVQLRELSTLLRRVLPDNVVVELRPGVDVPRVRVDRAMLDQVLLNLCVNARDAMPDGGRLVLTTGALTVAAADHLAGQLEPGCYATITVADTGTGLAPAALERVFEPFFTTKPAGVGTGLGLAVAYGIVRQHAGTITCTSAPGAGTTFTIHLPADLAPASEPIAPPPAADPGTAGAARAHAARILLAEDDAAVRVVTTRLLEAAGYQVIAAPDGETACARAADEPFDLAIVDMVMPGISGVETVERLRAARPGLPVIVASGYVPSSLALARLGRDAVELREKPYRPDELLATIDRMLARRGRR